MSGAEHDLPHPSSHVIVIDEIPRPEGWGVFCIPHGQIGFWPDRVEAFLRALEHDAACGGDTAS